MKKIISFFMSVLILIGICTFTSYAANDQSFNFSFGIDIVINGQNISVSENNKYDADTGHTENTVFEDTLHFYKIISEDTAEFCPTIADARYILQYSAGLAAAPADTSEAKRFFFMCDTDLDGIITSSDARTALRIAAKLEKGKVYKKTSAI